MDKADLAKIKFNFDKQAEFWGKTPPSWLLDGQLLLAVVEQQERRIEELEAEIEQYEIGEETRIANQLNNL